MDTAVPSTFSFLESSKRAAPSIQELHALPPHEKHACLGGEGAQELSETVPGNTYRKLPRRIPEMTTTTFISILTPGQHLGYQVCASLMSVR